MMEERLTRLCDEVDQLLAQVLADWSNSMVETYRPAGFPFDRLASDLNEARAALYRSLRTVERGGRRHGHDDDDEAETVRRTIKIDVDEEEVSTPRPSLKSKR